MKKFFQPASNTTETLSPTSLLDLVNNKLPLVLSSDEISNRKTLIKNLIDTLHLSHPSRLETKDSGYFSQKYNASMTDSEALLTNRMTIAISEKLFDPISPTSLDRERTLFWPNFSEQFWQPSLDMKGKSKELYLFHKAMTFKHTHHGNCAHRSCFSAIELEKILRGSAITVTVKSDHTRDHFFIELSLPDSTTLIYDPLTNPELLFDAETHQEKILPLIQPVTQTALPFELTINERHIRQYELILKRSENFLDSQKSQLSVERIISNPFFIQMQLKENIPVEKFNELITTALSRLNKSIDSHQSVTHTSL
ncbi:MAG: hypothetical protein CMF55_03930 [Legionellales bacterium]|nr:hypothetical protein [Legionellales bacterium]